MKCTEYYEQIYRRECESVSFAPYRICLLGAHIDHQLGMINGMAINRGIHLAYGVKHNGVIELNSLDFSKRAQFHINSVPENKEGDWADYLRGAVKVLVEKYPIKYGLCGVFEGDLPIGGLSSSAAITICFLKALTQLNNIKLSDMELIDLSRKAENHYVGVACGVMDQSCIVLSKRNCLLSMDTSNNCYELIPTPSNMPDYKIAIIFSGLQRSLVSTNYNLRQDECKAAAYALMAYSGMNYGKFVDARLRNISQDVFERYKELLPVNWKKRATHYYEEINRVSAGIACWKKGDLNTYGKMIFESGMSSIRNYESGSEHLVFLFETLLNTSGIYGGRFSGAGFNGCCMALVESDQVDDIDMAIREKYLTRYPEMKGKYGFFICESADGVGV